MSEYGLFSKEVALNLEINSNTLRRWSLELEKEGYEFTRNDKDQRIYYDRDIVVLIEFQKMVDKTQSLENAAKAVVARFRERGNAEKMLSVIENERDKIVFTKAELNDLVQKIANDTAINTAEIIMRKFNDSVERRDRQIVQSINQLLDEKQEHRKALIDVKTENQSLWKRWFGSKKSE